MPTIKAKIGGTWVPIGGGGDEVWVGADTPTDNNVELWYDTDEPNLADTNTARWNSAWGVIAQATFVLDFTLTAGAYVTLPGTTISFTPVAGRLYRTIAHIGTVTSNAQTAIITKLNNSVAGTTLGSAELAVFVNGQAPVTIPGPAQSFTGGQVQTLYMQTYCGAATSKVICPADRPGSIVVEDVGPVTLGGNPPAAPPSVWTTITLMNGFYSSTGSLVQYRKIGDVVELRGQAERPGGGDSSQPMFNLPAGCTPPADVVHPVNVVIGGVWGANGLWVQYVNNRAALLHNGATQVSLFGVSWSVTP